MDLEEQAKKITSILVDLQHENRYINKINEQRDSVTAKLNAELAKKRKEIQGIYPSFRPNFKMLSNEIAKLMAQFKPTIMKSLT
jgi:hypothetical protein